MRGKREDFVRPARRPRADLHEVRVCLAHRREDDHFEGLRRARVVAVLRGCERLLLLLQGRPEANQILGGDLKKNVLNFLKNQCEEEYTLVSDVVCGNGAP